MDPRVAMLACEKFPGHRSQSDTATMSFSHHAMSTCEVFWVPYCTLTSPVLCLLSPLCSNVQLSTLAYCTAYCQVYVKFQRSIGDDFSIGLKRPRKNGSTFAETDRCP